jgi:hypothetical protein
VRPRPSEATINLMGIPRAMKAVLLGALLSGLPGLAGCGGGQDVTAASIQAARQRWQQARIHDYDLEWTSSGLRQAHYLVAVRNDTVRTITMLQPSGRRTVLQSHDPRYFGVDGLFLVMADELAQLGTDRPFGQPRGTKVVLRFTPDPKLGYPRRYRRDVVGARSGLSIDVLRLTPNSAAAP